jgi:hypothetical protein
VRQVIGGSILVAATVAVLSLALWSPLGEQPEPNSPGAQDSPSVQASPSTSSQSTSPTPPVTPRPTGALPDASFVRCTTSYSVERLNQASAFAFDGTVVAIRPIPSESPGGDAGYVDVTFEVNDWYAGGSGTRATVDMVPPDVHAFESTPPSYQAGTRLLLSGDSRSGTGSMDQAVANGCGFTRYYDEQTANAWRDAFS